jgi:hypothetical protein
MAEMSKEQAAFVEAKNKARNALTDFVILARDSKGEKGEKGIIFEKSHEVVNAISDMVLARLKIQQQL